VNATQTALIAAIADDLPIAICIVRPSGGKVAYANQAAADILGTMPTQFPVGYVRLVTLEGEPYPEDRRPFVRAIKERRTVIAKDFAIQRADGRRVKVRSLAKPIFDESGEIAFVALAFSDITSEAEVHDQLRLAERQLRYMVDHAPVILYGFDMEGRVTLSEGRGLESMGLKPGELVGKSVFDVYRDSPDAMRDVRRALAGEEFQVTSQAGGITFDVVFAPIRGPKGEQVGVSGVAINVTDRERARAQQVQADRMGALGTLAASVAHEVNTPLAYVAESLNHVIDRLPALADGRDLEGRIACLSELLEEARRGLEQVKVIASDLHAFARPEERVGAVDLRKVLESALRMASNETRHCARLCVELGALPPVRGNEGRLAQVFLNLLSNAAQALPDGQAAEHEIRVIARTSDGQAEVEVSDTGRGIEPGVLPHIFEPFFTTKPVGSGTGLGLAVTRSIVESFGGQISVRSEPGRGTSFTVRLPAAPEPAAEACAVSLAPRGRPRVLIVDDNEALSRVLQVTLRDRCALEVVGSGREALARLLEQAPYELVLCDVMMPDLTGIDVYETLRAQRPGYERAICFMTGGAFTPRAKSFLASVPNRCLQKPFDFAEEIVRELEARRTT
jgi:two-component system cell cycle sensor histidine kinase/response regulator CckA